MKNLKSLVGQKCPKCGIGKMFKSGPYNLKSFTKMYDFCPNCKISYEPEPGFYVGAMYFSYAFNITIIISTGFISYWWFGFINIAVNISFVAVVVLILSPLLFRFSRALMLHLFGGRIYDS